tara:strand:- start:16 stop:456 length:441 start_codon:yes stop_codon:yes gene_type:complete
MNEILFLSLNSLIGFTSDIILNHLSNYKILNLHTLKPYFQNKSVITAGLYAMITVLIIVVIIMQTFRLYYNKTLPENTKETLVYLLLTFIIGYIADILIHKLDIFPKLKLYYKVIGSGLWGGLAILFSVSISLLFLYLYNRYNDEQ